MHRSNWKIAQWHSAPSITRFIGLAENLLKMIRLQNRMYLRELVELASQLDENE